MSHRRILGLLCAVVLYLLAIMGSAAADVITATLPLQGYGRMLVDSAHGHVFITPGASDSTNPRAKREWNRGWLDHGRVGRPAAVSRTPTDNRC